MFSSHVTRGLELVNADILFSCFTISSRTHDAKMAAVTPGIIATFKLRKKVEVIAATSILFTNKTSLSSSFSSPPHFSLARLCHMPTPKCK